MVRGWGARAAAETRSALSTVPTSSRLADAKVNMADDADVSLVSLEARRDLLTANANSLLARGVQLVSWGADIRRNSLAVGVHNFDAAAETEIAREVGAEHLVVSEHEVAQLANRTSDWSPWWGGDLLNTPTGGTCTSGFSMISGSTKYNSTAGHCGNGVFQQNSQPYGSTVRRSYSNNGPTDAQIISANGGSAPYIWYGTSSNSVIHTWSDPYVGYSVCFDGYYTHFACGTTNLGPMCVNFTDSGVTICGLFEAGAPSGIIVQNGDSGGPVVSTVTDAVGMIVGKTGTGQSSQYGYNSPVRAVTSALSVSIYTG